MRMAPVWLPRAGWALVGSLALLLLPLSPLRGADWTFWRGPWETGVSPETDLPDKFDPAGGDGSNVIWKTPIGSRCNPVIHKGRMFVICGVGTGTSDKPEERIREQERVLALDEKTGKVLWEYRFNVFHTDIVSDRLGWSNLACDPETGYIYAHGTAGQFYCFEPEQGKVVWSHSLTEEYGRVSGYGGRITSPIVDEDKVIIGMICAAWGEYARGANRFLAFDKKTGQVIWWGETGGRPRNTYFSTPVVAVINGQRLLISGGADGGVHAFKVRTGEKVWSHFYCAGSINCSPVVEGNRVYIAHGDENIGSAAQGRVICLDASEVKDGKPKLVWQVDGPKIKYCSPILHNGRLYVADEAAILYCFDTKDGKQLWKYKYGRNSMGSPVLADGKIYLPEVNGRFDIIKDGGTKAVKLHSQRFTSRLQGVACELNGSPAVANGRVFFSTSEDTYCLGKADAKPAPEPTNTLPRETAARMKAAWLQVVPADVSLIPGDKETFKARLYDADGKFIKETTVAWSLAPMLAPPPLPGVTPPPGPKPPVLKGELTKDGTYTAPKEVNGQFGRVVAMADGLEGYARVRQPVILPYKQDFEKVPVNRTPGGWVNTQGKFGVRKVGDSNVLVKLATNPSPLVARANAFIGMPTLTNYTIEADVMGQEKGNNLPDMGVVANRYTFVLIGQTQTLRLISWDALPRVDRTISYPWKAGVWYRLKLSVDVEGDKALVRGKIWEKGKSEPEKWTLEVTDPVANKRGSPALYANATGFVGEEPGTEAYFDNVVITPNKKAK